MAVGEGGTWNMNWFANSLRRIHSGFCILAKYFLIKALKKALA